jgi:hypothetical protein
MTFHENASTFKNTDYGRMHTWACTHTHNNDTIIVSASEIREN